VAGGQNKGIVEEMMRSGKMTTEATLGARRAGQGLGPLVGEAEANSGLPVGPSLGLGAETDRIGRIMITITMRRDPSPAHQQAKSQHVA
jgi:hypothetical protein